MADEMPLAIYPERVPEWAADDEKATPEEFLCPLLTCGHYGDPIFEASSQWDFPHEARKCPTCGEERQMDLRLQIYLETT